ncbi:hypothetical protein G9A89_022614, partial [Geosiphon pyriformis]
MAANELLLVIVAGNMLLIRGCFWLGSGLLGVVSSKVAFKLVGTDRVLVAVVVDRLWMLLVDKLMLKTDILE